MNTFNQKKTYRWVLLRHTGAPDDPIGIHYDFLLEDKDFCRTWRLGEIPIIDGPYVNSIYISPHHLDWLDIKEKFVSGNRGFAKRIKKGSFLKSIPSIEKSWIHLSIEWDNFECDLVIDQNGFRLFSNK